MKKLLLILTMVTALNLSAQEASVGLKTKLYIDNALPAFVGAAVINHGLFELLDRKTDLPKYACRIISTSVTIFLGNRLTKFDNNLILKQPTMDGVILACFTVNLSDLIIKKKKGRN